MEGLKRTLRWLTAVALVGSLYAHTFFNVDTSIATPFIAILIAGLLAISTALWLARPDVRPPPSLARQWSFVLLYSAIFVWIVISLFHLISGQLGTRDIGQFGIYCGVPIFILLNSDRVRTANAIGLVCVIFALMDLFFNIGVIYGFFQPVLTTQFVIEGQLYDRYPGISGSILAAGLVCLIGSCYAAFQVRTARSLTSFVFWVVILLAVFVGLLAVEARRYLLETIVAIFLILTPFNNRFFLPFVAPAIASFGLYETFQSVESGDILRRSLMIAGWRDLQAHFWTGAGILYHEASTGRFYAQLWNAHVTESGFIDLGLAFGVPAVILFLAAITISLLARRSQPTWTSILVFVMLGEFAYGGPLGGFLGATIFYLALLILIFDELPANSPQQSTVRYPIPSPA